MCHIKIIIETTWQEMVCLPECHEKTWRPVIYYSTYWDRNRKKVHANDIQLAKDRHNGIQILLCLEGRKAKYAYFLLTLMKGKVQMILVLLQNFF